MMCVMSKPDHMGIRTPVHMVYYGDPSIGTLVRGYDGRTWRITEQRPRQDADGNRWTELEAEPVQE